MPHPSIRLYCTMAGRIHNDKYNNIYINNQNIRKDILLKSTTTMKKRIHLTETGNFHIGETDVDEKCTK
jgi:hypothetical protein